MFPSSLLFPASYVWFRGEFAAEWSLTKASILVLQDVGFAVLTGVVWKAPTFKLVTCIGLLH